jgi:hypothetical protein
MTCPPCSGTCSQGRKCPDRPITTHEEAIRMVAWTTAVFILAILAAIVWVGVNPSIPLI